MKKFEWKHHRTFNGMVNYFKKTLVGQDVNMETNILEGYLCVQKPKKFYEKEYYQLVRTNPMNDFQDEIEDAILENYNQFGGIVGAYSWNDLLELYKPNKKGIDNCAATDRRVNFENPTIWDFLMLADDIDGYCGLS
jgi:hypothetical protein